MNQQNHDTLSDSTLLELKGVDVDAINPDGSKRRLIDGVDLRVSAGEVVALLGPTGSGKSALVRLASGLSAPEAGQVLVRGLPLRGVSPRVGVVFQNPALFPWLSVQSNIELGLERLDLSTERKASMTAWAIDRLGLDGHEEAYPRELSAGMKTRVALARALASQPDLLILDNPFSGLDVLTAESLRGEVMALWQLEDVNPKAILLVTNDIHEAVALAHRVLILSGSPAKLSVEVPVGLSFPRDPQSSAFRDRVNLIHDVLTKNILPDEGGKSAGRFERRLAPLPKAEIGQVMGLIEALDDAKGKLDIFDFVEETRKEYHSVLMVVNAAEMLDLVRTPGDQVELSELGRQVVAADVNTRKALLNIQLQRLRFFSQFIEMIPRTHDNAVSRDLVLQQLALLFPSESVAQLFSTMVAWGRYAELMGYSARRGLLYLDRLFVLEGTELREARSPKPARAKGKSLVPASQDTDTAPLPEPPAPPEEVLLAAEALGASQSVDEE